MSEFPEPQQESAAACENRDNGPFRKGLKQMTSILTFIFFYKFRGGSTQFLRNILLKTILKDSHDPENLDPPK